MLPDRLLSYSLAGPVVVPHLLAEHDQPWLRALLDEHARFIGRPQRELDARLAEPLPCESPLRKLGLAVQVLGRLQRVHPATAAVPPRQARALVFMEATRAPATPLAVLSTVAATLGVTARDLRDSLFADLPGERLVRAPAKPVSPIELALRSNLALVQALLSQATAVTMNPRGTRESWSATQSCGG